MRSLYAIAAVWVLAATCAQAQVRTGPTPPRMPPQVVRPAMLAEAKDRIVVAFTLTRQNRSFTYEFIPPEAGTYTAAARWEAAAAMRLTVGVPSARGPHVKTGAPPLGIPFRAGKDEKCTIVVESARGAVRTTGELAVLTGAGERVRKRMPPRVAGMANGVAKIEGKDALLPIIVRLMDRHLANAPDKNELDRAFERALARHPGVSRELLSRFVSDYNALPMSLKQQVFVQEAMDAPRLAPVTTANLRSATSAPRPTLRSVGAVVGEVRPSARPHIREVQPASGPQGYTSGQELTIVGSGFAEDTSDNRIEYWPDIPPPDRITFGGSQAYEGTTERITFRIPPTQRTGSYYMRVYISGTSPLVASNHVPIEIYRPPEPAAPQAPKPVITRIIPENQQPGDWVNIDGQNFQPGKTHWIFMSLLGDVEEPVTLMEDVSADSSTRMRLRIPRRLLPGDYEFKVRIVSGNAPESDGFTYRVGAPRYRVTFDQMECLDESNPEWWGDDEIVTFWGIVADDVAWQKNTDEYGNFHDGKVRDYRSRDRNVFPPNGEWTPVQQRLVIVTRLYEWDYGNVNEAQEFIGFLNDVAAGMSIAGGLGFGAVVMEAIADLLNELIGIIASWFGGDPDHLGTDERSWDYYSLQTILERGGTSPGTIVFRNSDGKGSYFLRYTMHRE